MDLPWHRSELQRLVEEGERLSHALLIRGPKGIGKLDFAQALAKALLCEQPHQQGMACGRCSACAWVEQRSHPDFRLVEPESLAEPEDEEGGDKKKASVQIGVDQVRALAELVNLSSHRGRAKIIVVHPAEALNPSAANALLKSLEEPPPATYFLLVSHRWHQLLGTIKSRCRQVVLPLPDRETARAWLTEQGASDPDLALAQAGGAPVWAASFDAEYWEQRAAFIGAIASADFDPLRSAEQLRDVALPDVVKWLQQWSYDMVLHGCVGRVRYSLDFADSVARAARCAGPLETSRFHRQMLGSQRVVSHPLNPRLFLEQLLLSYATLLRAARPGQAA
jgi:DNA polymerase III subunit delta'